MCVLRFQFVSVHPDKPRSSKPLASDIAAMAFVQSSSLCRDLTPEMVDEVIAKSTVDAYDAAQVVLEEGEHDNALFFVVEGSVSICKRSGASFVPLATLERPAVFGETAVLTQQGRTATVVTQTDVTLVRVPGELVRSLAERAPTVGRMLATLMAARAKDTEKKLAT
jgi:CRP-like cAMP-binding protein